MRKRVQKEKPRVCLTLCCHFFKSLPTRIRFNSLNKICSLLSQHGRQKPVVSSSFTAKVFFEYSKKPSEHPPRRRITPTVEGLNRPAEETQSHLEPRPLHTHLQVVTGMVRHEPEVTVNPKLSRRPFVLVQACQGQHQVSDHDLENQHRHIIMSLMFLQGREYLVNDPPHRQRFQARLQQPPHPFHDPSL